METPPVKKKRIARKGISEKSIQKEILDYLMGIGAVVVKINNGGIYNPITHRFIPPRQKGISDILCCYKGFFLAIEVKGKYTKPSPDQLTFLEQVRTQGGFAIWTCKLQDVIDLIEGI